MRKKWLGTLLIAVGSFVTGGWLMHGALSSEGSPQQQARLFESVLTLIDAHFVDSVGEGELYRRAASGLVERLDDPYAALYFGADFDHVRERTTGNYGGVGAQVDVRSGWITIVAPMPNSPAERAGLQSGDQVIQIDGVSTQGWPLERAAGALRGDVGTPVRLLVRRPGVTDPIPVRLVRAEIHRRAVTPGIFLAPGIGYLSLDLVTERSASEVAAEVARLHAQGMQGLILDLRGNPGGVRDEAVDIADLFLPSGTPILLTQGRTAEDNQRFVDSRPEAWPNLPVVVLVDGGSASAAEIVAGALQDQDRALIVGVPTFGKGLVQTQYRLGRDVALRFTTARWFTPSGRSIQRAVGDLPGHARRDTAAAHASAAGRPLSGGGGIVPDVVVPADTIAGGDRELARVLNPNAATYRDALTAVALDLKRRRVVLAEDFTVTTEMRKTLLDGLRQRGVQLDDATFSAGRALVDRQLAFEISRYLLGPTSEVRRRASHDGQVQRAVDLLRLGGTTATLLGLAPTARPGPS